MPIFQKECPVCHAMFQTERENALYDRPACRRHEERRRAKNKDSMFYRPNTSAEASGVLWVLSRPTLEELEKAVTLVTAWMHLTNEFRVVKIYGILPDGWEKFNVRPFVLSEDIGSKPQHWNLAAPYLERPVEKPKYLPLIVAGRVALPEETAKILLLEEEQRAQEALLNEI